MASAKRIPTPLLQHVRRFRLQALPVIVFFGLVLLISGLWNSNQGGSGGGWISGEVHSDTFHIYSSNDGILMPVSLTRSATLDMLAEVDEGDIIARIDPRMLNEELAALRSDLDGLKADLHAAEIQLELERAERADDKLSLIRRLSLDSERMELDLLDRKTQLASDQVEAMRAESEYLRAEAASRNGAENDYLLESRKHMRDYFRNQVSGQTEALAKAEAQLEKTRSRLGQLLAIRKVDIRTETILAPIRHSIASQAALVRSMEIQKDMLEIHSPATGRITAVYRQPGQAVRKGDILMTITREYSSEVVAYIRESQNIKLGRGQSVLLRNRFSRQDPVKGVVQRVGRMVTELPARQWRSPDQPEFGLPVCISIDPASGLAPGQLLDISPAATSMLSE